MSGYLLVTQLAARAQDPATFPASEALDVAQDLFRLRLLSFHADLAHGCILADDGEDVRALSLCNESEKERQPPPWSLPRESGLWCRHGWFEGIRHCVRFAIFSEEEGEVSSPSP